MASLIGKLSKLIPFPVRVEGHRLKRWFSDLPSPGKLAGRRVDPGPFSHVLFEARSPLERVPGAVEARLQKGKEVNVGLAVGAIDSTLVEPGQVLSYHRLVGRPNRLRGFKPGLELHDKHESVGVGGGLCQVSNLLYWVAINAGLTIIERHRHGFDLFPDHQRTVPFGCGATVFYNYRDLRFENPLPQPVLVQLRIENRQLVGRMRTRTDPGWTVAIEERDHRFFEQDGLRMRENRIHRRIIDSHGGLIEDGVLTHNRCEVKY